MALEANEKAEETKILRHELDGKLALLKCWRAWPRRNSWQHSVEYFRHMEDPYDTKYGHEWRGKTAFLQEVALHVR